MYSINGAIFNTNDLNISTQNRGLNYGDGVFETIRVKDKTILYAQSHYDRLLNACQSISIQLNIKDIQKWVIDIINVANITNGIIKINVIREDGGLFTPIGNNGNVIIRARETPSNTEKKIDKIEIYDHFEKVYSSTSAFKTTNCIEYIKAGLYKQEESVDDLILVNQKKEVVECLYSNIIWIKNEQWYTPSIKTGCIGGIMLQQIESELIKKDLIINHGSYSVEELLDADTVINSNITGIKYLSKIGKTTFNTDHPIINDLNNKFS